MRNIKHHFLKKFESLLSTLYIKWARGITSKKIYHNFSHQQMEDKNTAGDKIWSSS